jgi:hypothetical protein
MMYLTKKLTGALKYILAIMNLGWDKWNWLRITPDGEL